MSLNDGEVKKYFCTTNEICKANRSYLFDMFYKIQGNKMSTVDISCCNTDNCNSNSSKYYKMNIITLIFAFSFSLLFALFI